MVGTAKSRVNARFPTRITIQPDVSEVCNIAQVGGCVNVSYSVSRVNIGIHTVAIQSRPNSTLVQTRREGTRRRIVFAGVIDLLAHVADAPKGRYATGQTSRCAVVATTDLTCANQAAYGSPHGNRKGDITTGSAHCVFDNHGLVYKYIVSTDAASTFGTTLRIACVASGNNGIAQSRLHGIEDYK